MALQSCQATKPMMTSVRKLSKTKHSTEQPSEYDKLLFRSMLPGGYWCWRSSLQSCKVSSASFVQAMNWTQMEWGRNRYGATEQGLAFRPIVEINKKTGFAHRHLLAAQEFSFGPNIQGWNELQGLSRNMPVHTVQPQPLADIQGCILVIALNSGPVRT